MMKKTNKKAIQLPRAWWFTSIWKAQEIVKTIKKPSYLLGVLNVFASALVTAVLSILIFRGGFEGIDFSIYSSVILTSVTKYILVAIVFSFTLVSTHKGSLKKMFYLTTFPLAGYMFTVNVSLILNKIIPNFPIGIVLKSLLILFVIAAITLGKEETKTEYWESSLWLVAALALADFAEPMITEFVTSLF